MDSGKGLRKPHQRCIVPALGDKEKQAEAHKQDKDIAMEEINA